VAFTITLGNQGHVAAQSTVLDPISEEISVITETLQASTGTTRLTTTDTKGTVLSWESTLDVGSTATLTFSALVTDTISGSPVRNRAVVTELGGQRQADTVIIVMPTDLYLPQIMR
jgi:hypothetical protein